mmetsp:Transcript_22652/g.49606  ORF Transcript_22652/g.49606 Transcript_22652/m.49606 type:complete len:94 (+) Transcript_22652:3740-4021(+)
MSKQFGTHTECLGMHLTLGSICTGSIYVLRNVRSLVSPPASQVALADRLAFCLFNLLSEILFRMLAMHFGTAYRTACGHWQVGQLFILAGPHP